MDTINSFGGKDAIAEVDVRHMGASLKQLLLNMWLVLKCKFFFVCLQERIPEFQSREQRYSKMLIVVEMKTVVYYKIWKH